jgi:hypothetical protein
MSAGCSAQIGNLGHFGPIKSDKLLITGQQHLPNSVFGVFQECFTFILRYFFEQEATTFIVILLRRNVSK